jgi:hypothetical protein
MKLSWNNPQCESCWIDNNSSTLIIDGETVTRVRYPHKVADPELETCAWCGHLTIIGIYVRANPESLPYPKSED